MTNKAVQFLHLTQEQQWNKRAGNESWQHRFTETKIEKCQQRCGPNQQNGHKSLFETDDYPH